MVSEGAREGDLTGRRLDGSAAPVGPSVRCLMRRRRRRRSRSSSTFREKDEDRRPVMLAPPPPLRRFAHLRQTKRKKKGGEMSCKTCRPTEPRPSGLYQRYWQYNEGKKKIEGIDERVISPNKIRGKEEAPHNVSAGRTACVRGTGSQAA